ncbi:glutathione S-transferase [Xylariaceae sp. FL1651]|nr:glutathione S-transferase [Xylariaceae sp. FL1651]
MAPPSDLPIVLYHYEQSPYARRLIWYLNLRKIPYSQCIQPRIMPRPDVALLGISYRRIPILSIGRDVYLDTRLILQKLEALFPPSASHPGISSAHAASSSSAASIAPPGIGAEHTALEQLLSARAIDGALFNRGAQCFPPGAFSADPAFARDRAALFGVDVDRPGAASPFAPDVVRRQRPEALAAVRAYVCWLEDGLLADGRRWILDSNAGGGGPSLADIEAGWVLHWVSGVPGALPAEVLGPESAPRVHAWLGRFRDAVREAGESGVPKPPPSLKGEEAAAAIVGAAFAEPEGTILGEDPIVAAEGLRKGEPVEMWPADYGSSHRDSGSLLVIDRTEFVIEARGKFGSVRVHAPRHGFKIARRGSGAASKI